MYSLPRKPTTHHVRPRPDLRRRRPARRRDPRFSCPSAADRDGAEDRRGAAREPRAGGGGRHRHRQDLRLPGAGAAGRGQGHHLHRHQDAAGPALQPRPAHRARRVEGAGDDRAAEGARQLRLPLPPRAQRARRPLPHRAGRRRPARDHALRQAHADRRQGRMHRRARGLAGLARRDLDTRQLPRPGLPAQGRVLRDAGAAQRDGGRRGGGQSPPLLRRRDVARRGHGRAAAGVQRGDLRRGPPAPRDREPVLRRQRVHRPGAGAGARYALRDRGRGARLRGDDRPDPQPGKGRTRPAPGVRAGERAALRRAGRRA